MISYRPFTTLSYIWLGMALTLSSCATILNGPAAVTRVHADRPFGAVINGRDTILSQSSDLDLALERSSDTLDLLLFDDTLNLRLLIPSKRSFAYWLNSYPYFLPGFIVDAHSPKRFRYPKHVYIDFDSSETVHWRPKPSFDSLRAERRNLIKFNLLRPLGVYNPGAIFSFERVHGVRWSTQVSAGALMRQSLVSEEREEYPKLQGWEAAIEQRYHLRTNAPAGFYVGAQARYRKSDEKRIERFGDEYFITDIDSLAYTPSYMDTIGVAREQLHLTALIGYQVVQGRVAVDIYAGLGMKYRSVVHRERLVESDDLTLPRHPNGHYATFREGKFWTVSLPFNVRVGYAF